MREERIGDCRLILGDCLDVVASFPPCFRVDAVVWDPPWGIGFSKYNTHIDDAAAYPAWISEALASAEARVAEGWFVVFQGARRAWEWASLVGGREYRILACAKNFTQILPGKGPNWATDFALFWPIGTPQVEHGKGRDFHIANTANMSTRPKGHPCSRPLDQISYIVECFSEKGQTVLDPTMGSGTTLVACAKLGRRGIGIEIDPGYFDIACKRVEDAYRQLDMFIERPAAPVQETLL